MALTGTTLGMRRRVASWVPVAILAYVSFAAYIIGGFYSFMASLMCLSLFSIIF